MSEPAALALASAPAHAHAPPRAGRVLPPELLDDILRLACSHSPSVAHALAYVSRDVCALSAPHRLRTVVLTSERSLERFWLRIIEYRTRRLVCADWGLPITWTEALCTKAADWRESIGARGELTQQQHAQLGLLVEQHCASDLGEQDDASFGQLYPTTEARSGPIGRESAHKAALSMPFEDSMLEIRNIFIDLAPEPAAGASLLSQPAPLVDPDDADEVSSLRQNSRIARGDMLALSEDLEAFRTSIAAHLATLLETHRSARLRGLARQCRELPSRVHHRLRDLFLLLSGDVQRLSLGATEFQVLAHQPGFVSPRELTFVYDGDDESLRLSLGQSSILARPDSPPDGPGALIWGLRRRLDKLHVIGIDPRSPLSGINLPTDALDAVRAGSCGANSYIRMCTAELAERSDEPVLDAAARTALSKVLDKYECTTGVRYLRYDTRKFGFRPVEITCSRLSPFVHEVEVLSCRFEHADANGLPPNAHEQERLAQHGQRATEWLKRAGAGGFQKLQLAWQSTPDAKRAEEMTASRRARFTAVAPSATTLASSAAPTALREKDRRREAAVALRSRSDAEDANGGWPKERKDVWTERSEQDLNATFGAEIVEGMRQTHGWIGPPAAHCVWARDQLSASALEAHRQLEQMLDGALSDLQDGQSRIITELGFKTRLPSSFMRFEGEAAFDKSTRIALFLDSAAGGKGAWD